MRLAQTPLQKQPMPEARPAPPANGAAPTPTQPESAPPPSTAQPPVTEAPAPAAEVHVPNFDFEKFLQELPDLVLEYAQALASTWTLLQALIIVLCFGAARLIAKFLTPPLEAQLRHIESQPQLLRVLIIPLRRMTGILFAFFLWLTAYIMQEYTWPSRSYYVSIAATLALAGVAISITSRFIRNRTLANLYFYTAWVIAGLHIVGLLSATMRALDSAAFSVGAFRLSLLAVLKAVILLTVLIWLAAIVGNFLERKLRQNEDLAPALQVLLAKFAKFAMITLAALVTISAVGIDLTALTVFSGALGLGIGFGLQTVASNLISGIIILSDRSIKPGDVISLGETFGWINALKSRYVSVITRDGVEYLIPNESFVSQQVVNWSYSNRNVRQEIKFGTSYNADPHEVRKIAVEAVANLDRVLERPGPVSHIIGFGDSSVDYVLRFWIRDPKNGLANIRGNAFLAMWDAFKKNGVEIPYPHRQLILPENLDITTKAATKKSARRTSRRKS
jgi:small-conductance mechanosensitive channel